MEEEKTNDRLTDSQILQINDYVASIIRAWLGWIGIANLAALAGALVYIFFILPDKAVSEVRTTLGNKLDETLVELALTKKQLETVNQDFAEVKKAYAQLKSDLETLSKGNVEHAAKIVRTLQEVGNIGELIQKISSVDQNQQRQEQRIASVEGDIRPLKGNRLLYQVDVLSIDHSSGKTGQFFNFNVSDIDKILDTSKWDSKQFTIINSRTGKIGPAIVWRRPNGGSIGDGHGRWDDGLAAPNQWQLGDRVIILNAP